MNILCNIHKAFLRELLKAEVNFILVGGYAIIYHGYVRVTGDMDIWLEPANDNKEKLLPILEKLNFSNESIIRIQKLDFTQMVAFHFGNPPEKIDFLTKMTGIYFNDAMQHSEKLELDNFKIPILRLDDLIVNKLLSNRTKDKADVEELQKIQKLRGKRRNKN
jgi:predicted nucleotidyltransferase